MSAAPRPLRIGTRGSELALWQARRVAELIGKQDGAPQVELIRIRTEGDARTDIPLWQTGGRAFFTREIDRSVASGEVDLAVHSLKDLATALDAGLGLSAVLEREDPRDALLVRPGLGLSSIAALPAGARVGTSSLRRRAFLARARRDLQILELRGNVPTRIERLGEGRFDAIVLAAAGVKRLGLERHVSAHLPVQDFTPAVSQGAIGVVSRGGDAETARWLTPLDHTATRLETLAERALLRRVEGGCQVPLGALGRAEGGRLTLYACVCALDGSDAITADGAAVLAGDMRQAGRERAAELGEQLAEDLLA
ncbi:MAG: hydroxymethylbilane synthase, partial [Steroidobacteraceae bacterium]